MNSTAVLLLTSHDPGRPHAIGPTCSRTHWGPTGPAVGPGLRVAPSPPRNAATRPPSLAFFAFYARTRQNLLSSRSPIHAQHYSPLVLSADRHLIEALGSRKLESFELQFEMLYSGIKMAAVATIFESPCLGPFRSRSKTKLPGA